jgi:hypothetical protein
MRKRTSPIWVTSKEDLELIVRRNNSISSILKDLNLDPHQSGSRYRSLKQRLKEDKIDYSHIPLGSFANKGRKFVKEAFPLEEVMVENSTYHRGTLKKRLLRNGMLENKCSECGQEPEWKGKNLVMVLDHINGIRNDNRFENLRMLCPNCNSQQSTFSGRSNKILLPKCRHCKINSVSRRSKTGLCLMCYANNYVPRKVKNRPSKVQLLIDIEETNYSATGRKYGVCDNTIRKWLR